MAKKNKYQWNSSENVGEEVYISRSQKKRDSTALQKLGEELTTLSASQLKKIPLTQDLHDALSELLRIKDKEGRRRHMQYIGRLMREADGDAIRTAVEAVKLGQTRANQKFHQAERLRDMLLQAEAKIVEELLKPWPKEYEELCALIQKARQERSQSGASSHSAKELFRRLHMLL